MTDEPLSQEMIDALLQQAGGGASAPDEAPGEPERPGSEGPGQADDDAFAAESAGTTPEPAAASPRQAASAEGATGGTRAGTPGQARELGAPLNVPGLQISAPDPGGEAFGIPGPREGAAASEGPAVRPAVFSPLPAAAAHGNGSSIDLLLDVPLQVTVELGRTNLSVREVLGLGAGSVVELEKLAGEPIDLLVNNRLIARGEVVVIDESFGVRVTEIVRSGSGISLRR